MPPMEPLAILFDWDGVVVDSSRQHKAAWERMAARDHLPLPDDHFARSFGMRNPQIIVDMFHWTTDPVEAQRLADRKEAIFREIVQETGLEALPGIRRLLDDLFARDVPCAIASSTPRENLDCALDLLGLHDRFAHIVASEDVRIGKPDPEVFLKAAAGLGAEPRHCVVIEDAHVGIAAGKQAGMTVVAVATTHPADSLRAADHVVKSLESVTVDNLLAWRQGA
ncbi:MAG: HAD family phosphatase [Lentisphaerae bacterium]|nr:HAD family phosphatase [Lentisphaerota bacterium]